MTWHVFQGTQPSSSTSWFGAPNSSASGSAKIHTDEDLPRRIHRPNEKWACQNDVKQKGPDFFVKSFIIWNGCIQRLHDWKLSWHDDSTTRIVGGSMRSILFIVGFTCTSTIFLGDDVTFLPLCKNGQHRQVQELATLEANRLWPNRRSCHVDFKQEGRGIVLRFLCSWQTIGYWILPWTMCPQRIDQLHRI